MKFTFEKLGNSLFKFQGTLQCRQCTGHRADGARCTRNTCKYLPMCFQHLRKEMGLVVKQSTIAAAGLGLFAARDFESGSWIAPVDGERLTKQQLDNRYDDFLDEISAPYGVRVKNNEIADGALQRWVGHYSNTKLSPTGHSLKTGTNATISFRGVGAARTPWLKATKSIRDKDEILTWYGSAYTIDNQTRSRTR